MYYIYILRCNDDSLYTGITTHLERRVQEHNISSKGAKYTKMRRPCNLVYYEMCENRSQASKREIEIKKMTKIQKEKICSAYFDDKKMTSVEYTNHLL